MRLVDTTHVMDSQNPNDIVSAFPTSGFHVDFVFTHVVHAPEDPILRVLSLSSICFVAKKVEEK